MTKTILILGASFAGLKIAHKLLKKTLATTDDYKLVLVSPSTHVYWNPATVRAIIPGLLPDEKLFADIRPGFKQYPDSKFSFIHGTATSLSPSTKSVQIKEVGSQSELTQAYDILIICTGSRYEGENPWKGSLEGYEATKMKLHDMQQKVKDAKSIVVGGGGPTGVEVAAELGFEYGKKGEKEITLITGGSTLISPTVPSSVHNASMNELTKLNVSILLSTKITSSKKVGSQYELSLSDGSTKTVDLYLATSGVTPNTEYLPKNWLNEKGEIKMDASLKVKDAQDVWAAGDVVDTEASQLGFIDNQANHIAKDLDAVLKGGQPTEYKPMGDMIAVTLGRSKATGRFANWKLPSILIWFMKGRTLFTEKLHPLISGNW